MNVFKKMVEAPDKLRGRNIKPRAGEQGLTEDEIIRTRLERYVAGNKTAFTKKQLRSIYEMNV